VRRVLFDEMTFKNDCFAEIELLQHLKHKFHLHEIGDDCAILAFDKKNYLLAASDILIENVHFKLGRDSFYEIGFKAIAVNVSDIAAMGGIPKYVLVSAGLPKKINLSQIDNLYQGLSYAAKYFGVKIVGGDTSRSDELIINVSILGFVGKKLILRRSGVKPEDLIFVTGTWGRAGVKNYKIDINDLQQIRLKEARIIARKKIATSLIDNSDGLNRCIYEICTQSKVGAEIYLEKVPLAKGASLDQALNGGEDFELLFTISAKKKNLLKKINLNCPITEIGKILASKKGISLINSSGMRKTLKNFGYDSFHS
jgi:thiamine-monophosphate kinase